MTDPSGCQQDSFPQETEPGPAVHLALDHLGPVDMAFDCSRAPGQGEASDDGIAVPVDACGESMETWQVILPDGSEPVRKTRALALGQHDGERADVPGERVNLGAVGANGFELHLFSLGKGFRAPENPSGDRSGRGWPGNHRSW